MNPLHNTTMRTKLIAAVAVAVSATAALTTPAHATTAGECPQLIMDLSTHTADATSLTAKNSSGLVDKAGAAAAKLDVGKITDALAKLTDYDSTLRALHDAAKPKVSDTEFVLLSGEVDAAITCVANIGAP